MLCEYVGDHTRCTLTHELIGLHSVFNSNMLLYYFFPRKVYFLVLSLRFQLEL